MVAASRMCDGDIGILCDILRYVEHIVDTRKDAL